jgi:hypothetical protein
MNVNQIWGKDEGGDTQLALARAAYDDGDFARADELAQKVFDNNQDNESAAILLGYINLSRGGIDPFRLARKLICITAPTQTGCEKENGGTTSTSTATTTAPKKTLDELDADIEQLALPSPIPLAGGTGTGTGTASAGDSASDAATTLKRLGSLLEISQAELTTRLTSGDFCTVMEAKGTACKSDLFKSATTKILVPNDVSEALRAGVNVLNYMNKSMKYICRFADDAVMKTSSTTDVDDRYTAFKCTNKPSGRGKDAAKAHFLFAFTHLTEAMVYQSVLLYNSGTGFGSNFQNASDSISAKPYEGSAGIDEFVSKVLDMKSAADSVFNTDNKDSMVGNTLKNLKAVRNGFSALSGIPPAMTQQITKALDKIEETAKKLGGVGGTTDSTKALKGQMTEKFSSVVGKKVSEVVDGAVKGNDYLSKNPDAAAKITTKEIDTVPDIAFAGEGGSEADGATKKAEFKKNLTSMCTAFDSLSAGLDPETKATQLPAPCKT